MRLLTFSQPAPLALLRACRMIGVPGVAGVAGNAGAARTICLPRLVWFGVRVCQGNDFADALGVKPG